ncbi:hypothetical protein V1512DRAFT_259524 [Lipomyces arxii]|uniref:uncharacterized protein n=1 Tax=Lipomyces arxii TaxID=56418 RepID=UPI0034CD485A
MNGTNKQKSFNNNILAQKLSLVAYQKRRNHFSMSFRAYKTLPRRDVSSTGKEDKDETTFELKFLRRQVLQPYLSSTKAKPDHYNHHTEDYQDNFAYLKSAAVVTKSSFPDPPSPGHYERVANMNSKSEDGDDMIELCDMSDLMLSSANSTVHTLPKSVIPSLENEAKSHKTKRKEKQSLSYVSCQLNEDRFAENVEIVVQDLMELGTEYEICEAEKSIQKLNDLISMTVAFLTPAFAAVVLSTIYGLAFTRSHLSISGAFLD